MICVLSQSIATPQECTHQFTRQPPAKLNCRPLETVIRLQCASSSPEDTVAWLWSRSKEQAGSNGTLIISNSQQSVYKILQHVHHLTIKVTESTLGYYWCEIRNAVNVSLRPTTITPVCPPRDNCLPQCTTQAVSRLHSNVSTCVETNNYSRPSLPDCTIPSPTMIQIEKGRGGGVFGTSRAGDIEGKATEDVISSVLVVSICDAVVVHPVRVGIVQSGREGRE